MTKLSGFLERESLQPDLNRAVRCVIAFMVPLLAAHFRWLPIDPVFACIPAQTIALVDVRGPYSLRLGLLVASSVILAAATALGLMGADNLPLALAGTVFVVGAGGLWRHLSTDYGPGMAVSSGLVFFLALGHHPHAADATDSPHLAPALTTLLGGGFGVLLQVALWPVRAQHPVRRTVAESWSALGNVLAAMQPEVPDQQRKIRDAESELRLTLNKTQASLHAAERHAGKVIRTLELLNIAAARLGMRIIVFRTAMEAVRSHPAFPQLAPALVPALTALTNTVRLVALAVVSRQPSHLATFEVGLKRLNNLLSVMQAQVTGQLGNTVESAHLVEIIRRVQEQLPIVRKALRLTLRRANERGAFPMELFDMQTLTLRPVASFLNLNARVEPALIRHSIRAIVLAAFGVVVYKTSGFPHGYWLPFTVLIVLQPDFGATREKAVQRVLGTLAGGTIASCLLWLTPPAPVILAAIAITIGLFAYFQKRNYTIAVIFVTLMIVLLTEFNQWVDLEFTLERMGSTLAGGLLALGAALVFWPVWERKRFPGIMAKALRANSTYVSLTIKRLKEGGSFDAEMVNARQAADSASSEVFSSLRRMLADPKNQQTGVELAAALANGNQRVTDGLSVISLHLNNQISRHPETLEEFEKLATAALGAIIESEETGTTPPAAGEVLGGLENFRLPPIATDHQDPNRFREPWTFPQLARITTELAACLHALRGGEPRMNKTTLVSIEPPVR